MFPDFYSFNASLKAGLTKGYTLTAVVLALLWTTTLALLG